MGRSIYLGEHCTAKQSQSLLRCCNLNLLVRVQAERIDFAVDFRCDFPLYYSHSEVMIHSEIDSPRLSTN